MFYEIRFLLSLGLTLITETTVAIFFINFFYRKKRIKIWKIIFIELISSSLTLPYLWFIFPIFIRERFLFLLTGETWVIVIEMLIYYQLLNLKLKESFIISLIKNTLSFGLSYFLK